MKNLKIGFFIAATFLFIFSCEKESFTHEKQSTSNTNPIIENRNLPQETIINDKMILGQKLQNPYSQQNMVKS